MGYVPRDTSPINAGPHVVEDAGPLHENITFTMEEKGNGELAFLGTLLKRNNGGISVLIYRKPTHTDQYLHYSSHHQTSCKGSVVSSVFNRAYSIITNKDDLCKGNARIKQVLKENGYRESIINKIFRRITNHSLPQSQELTQATDIQEEEIRMSINLLYVEGTSEKLRHILRSHKIRSTFYTESRLIPRKIKETLHSLKNRNHINKISYMLP